jgi:multidrug efflux pump subunit AcrB
VTHFNNWVVGHAHIGVLGFAGMTALGGLYYVLPRMEDPLLLERAAIINTAYPGADAAQVESLVTEPLEEELLEIEEIKEVRSDSRPGISTISIELRDDVYTVDEVWSRVRDRLDDARDEFPDGAGEPDFERLTVKAYALIVALAWDRSTDESPANFAILRRRAEQLKDRFKSLRVREIIT